MTDLPCVGACAFQLDRLLKRAGTTRDQFVVQSLDDPLPPGTTILAMGEKVLSRYVFETGMLRWRGRVASRSDANGWVIPTFHPRDLLPQRGKPQSVFAGPVPLRNPPRFTGAAIWDIRRAMSVAREGFTRLEPVYLCDPSPEEFSRWVLEFENALEREDVLLSWDIETPYKMKAKDEDEFEETERDNLILRISFSYRPGTGVSVPWDPRYLSSIKRLLSSRGTHVVWNGDTFDVPLVRANGLEVAGEVHDYMWGWHVYQSDLPMGLEFVSSFWSDILPWKHLSGAEPARYSAIDADAALRNALGIRDALRRTNQWDTFHRHVVRLDPILYDAGRRGNCIDADLQATLKTDLGAEKAKLIAQAQGIVPESVKPRKRYKKLPKYEEELPVGSLGGRKLIIIDGERRLFVPVVTIGKVKRCTHCRAISVKKSDHFKGGKKNLCKVAGGVIEVIQGRVVEWDEILPFNPNSTEQIKSYIRHFGHPMGTAKDDREKEAADSRHLEKLRKQHGDKHPLYALTIELHKVSKALSTYVIGFKPDETGRIHTTYTHATSTWRLSSRAVNLQNVGKRESNKWAKLARKQIIASPGNVFVQADSSAIEAVFVGYFMADPEYVDAARRGIHARLACHRLGWEFTPEAVARVKSEHKTLYDQCKITVHGTSYGMTPHLMIELFPDLFPSKGEAAEFQKVFLQMVPKLGPWQHEMRLRAHKETYLENPWKHRHYFYQVFSGGRDGQIVLGSDAQRVIAYQPQSSAGSFAHDNLLLMGDSWLRDYMPANVTVHDGYTVDIPKRLADKAQEKLVEILTRPIPEMDGLQVGCAVEVGVNWGEMEEIQVVGIAA